MKNNRKTIRQNTGARLIQIRNLMRWSPGDMASKIGISVGAYYKNENGETFPNLNSLERMQRDLNISMDWFIFNKGPMFYKEKEKENLPVLQEEKTPDIQKIVPDVQELLDDMINDPLLRHEVMLNYYKYKTKKENNPADEPSSGSDGVRV